MKSNEEKIYYMVKEIIDVQSGKTTEIQTVLKQLHLKETVLGYNTSSRTGQSALSEAITKLVSDGVISPIGKKSNLASGLFPKYRILNKVNAIDHKIKTNILQAITPPASANYYSEHQDEYEEDEPIISVILSILKQPMTQTMTVNELAYRFFDDEKFFKGDPKERSRGEQILRKLKLDYSGMGCEETKEPFFAFRCKNYEALEKKSVLIVENKDTFWTAKRQLLDIRRNPGIDLLIYGEGKKIIQSFSYITEYDIDPNIDVIRYFGDIDPEGINIFCDLKHKYPEYGIIPFIQAYVDTLEIGLSKDLKPVPKRQLVKNQNIEEFIEGFSEIHANKIKEIIMSGYYIPQEALNGMEIERRFGV